MPRGRPGVEVTLGESRLLGEFLATRYPQARIQMQPRLGMVRPELQDQGLTAGELRMLGLWRRYPDAAIFLPDRVILVEATLKPDPGKISLLDLYARLFPLTPEFSDFSTLPIEKVLVWALNDVAAEQIAREHGVRVEVFQPPWVREWLSNLERPRDRRAPSSVSN